MQKKRDERQVSGAGSMDGGDAGVDPYDECDKIVFDLCGAEVVDGICDDKEGERKGDTQVGARILLETRRPTQ